MAARLEPASSAHFPVSQAHGPRPTDCLVLQYPLQRTQAGSIEWSEGERSGCEAVVEGVRLELGLRPTRAGSRVLPTLHREQRSEIMEPPNTSFFGREYQTDEEREAADYLRALWEAVRRPMAARQDTSDTQRDRRKQRLYRRSLFGEA